MALLEVCDPLFSILRSHTINFYSFTEAWYHKTNTVVTAQYPLRLKSRLNFFFLVVFNNFFYNLHNIT